MNGLSRYNAANDGLSAACCDPWISYRNRRVLYRLRAYSHTLLRARGPVGLSSMSLPLLRTCVPTPAQAADLSSRIPCRYPLANLPADLPFSESAYSDASHNIHYDEPPTFLNATVHRKRTSWSVSPSPIGECSSLDGVPSCTVRHSRPLVAVSFW